jgi:flagellar protein FlaG
MDVSNINSSMAFDHLQTSAKIEKPQLDTTPKLEIQDKMQMQTQVSKEELASVVSSLNKEIEPMGTNIKFGYNSDINQLVVEVKNNITGEVIRQLPTKEALELSKKVKELVGIIFDKRA